MEDFSKIAIPQLPKIDSPKTFQISFNDEGFSMFESLLRTVLSPLGYSSGKRIYEDGKTTISFNKKRTLT